MTGTSLWRASEVLLVGTLPIFMSFIATKLYPYFVQDDRQWKRMLAVDFFTMTLPLLFSMTILEDRVLMLNVIAATVCGILVLFNSGNGGEERKVEARRPFITNHRGIILLISMTLILSVDFRVFPDRFKKSYRHGVNLMDTGLVLYQMINGTTYFAKSNRKKSPKRSAITILVVLALGVVKSVAEAIMNTSVNVFEYGQNWSLFYTIAVNLFVYEIAVLFPGNGARGLGFKGFVILVFHQMMLSAFLEDWVFSDIPRDNFISANREGIVQTVGLSGTFLLFIAYSFLFAETDPRKLYPRLALVAIFLGISSYVLVLIFDVSRTVANIAFLSYNLWLASILMPLHYVIEHVNRRFYSARTPYSPRILEAINYNPLVFFLLGNIFTGLYNSFFIPENKNPLESVIHLGLYMLLNTSIVSFMYARKIYVR